MWKNKNTENGGKIPITKIWSALEQNEAIILNKNEPNKSRKLANEVIELYKKIINISDFTDSQKNQFTTFFKEIQDYVGTRTEIFG